MSEPPRPENYPGVTPHVIVSDADKASAFYSKVFGAKELGRNPGPDGRMWYLEMLMVDGRLMLSDPFPELGLNEPGSYGGSPVMLHHYVEDVDQAFAALVEAGATPIEEPTDHFWGDRSAQVRDPFGHHWILGTRKQTLTAEEMHRRHDEAVARHKAGDTLLASWTKYLG